MGHADRRFLIVAGEPSGDAHAAALVSALRERGSCLVRGVTGPRLEAAGAERVVSMDELSVLGFTAVIARLPQLWRAYHRLLEEAASLRPDACVLVDSPGFNLRLGRELKRRGFRVFYYIAPQVWAWHPERAAEMGKWVDELAVVFPFEEELFRKAGVNATYVGHPLMDALSPEVDEARLRSELGIGEGRRIVGLLPGSRPGEIHHHVPNLMRAARLLAQGRPDLAFVLSLPARRGSVSAAALPSDPEVRELSGFEAPADPGSPPHPSCWMVRGRTHSVQAFASACAVASGTATLETALFGTPLAIVFRTGTFNYAIARRMVTLRRIGLPNIVTGQDVAPELIQHEFTPERLAATLAPWLDDPAAHARQVALLAQVRAKLGAPGASEKAAARLWEMSA
jgi:lipid-A-disaccharide synthase